MNSLEQYTDAEIIKKILDGETALFEILIRRNNASLYKVGRAYNYSHDDTQDLMQDSFIDAYLHLATFENRSSFKTWLIKIMLNHCFKKGRKPGFRSEAAASGVTDKSTPMFSTYQPADTGKTVTNRELKFVIENALAQIPLEYRMTFSLRELNGLNVSETAAALNISEANVKVRLNRAKAMLRKEIEKIYTPEDIFDFNLVYCDALTNNVMDKIRYLDT